MLFNDSVNGTLGRLFSCVLTAFWSCGDAIDDEYKAMIERSIEASHHVCDNLGGRHCFRIIESKFPIYEI